MHTICFLISGLKNMVTKRATTLWKSYTRTEEQPVLNYCNQLSYCIYGNKLYITVSMVMICSVDIDISGLTVSMVMICSVDFDISGLTVSMVMICSVDFDISGCFSPSIRIAISSAFVDRCDV